MSDKDERPSQREFDYHDEASDSEEDESIEQVQMRLFKKAFIAYRLKSTNPYVEEFIGDRVFNLYMARNLVNMYSQAGVAKAAFSIFTSNSSMSSALSYTNLKALTDCLASDLEITFYWADEVSDVWYMNTGVSIVTKWCLTNTEYSLQWFKATEALISKRESQSHSKRSLTTNTIKRDYNRDPVSQVMEICQAKTWVLPQFQFSQADGTWRCTTVFQDKHFSSVGLNKSHAKKAICSDILDELVRKSKA